MFKRFKKTLINFVIDAEQTDETFKSFTNLFNEHGEVLKVEDFGNEEYKGTRFLIETTPAKFQSVISTFKEAGLNPFKVGDVWFM